MGKEEIERVISKLRKAGFLNSPKKKQGKGVILEPGDEELAYEFAKEMLSVNRYMLYYARARVAKLRKYGSTQAIRSMAKDELAKIFAAHLSLQEIQWYADAQSRGKPSPNSVEPDDVRGAPYVAGVCVPPGYG